ncbi:protoporphyrinogen oxidase HemJ [Methylocella silvestris]|uniref:Protoporphyrinogen IX oxidase n=1 Tax=Methylocella silvestris TaxID=199596 RepID=A0A2J7TF70_METSI|nr:protoporphyrinogen oxidase HemJ [Methylocella silvestris]PNG25392.1 TIGR00701 family protein [Methylocella silvestris]
MTLYLAIKAVHILAVIAWMAGMLYLPRLFVYHAGAAQGSELAKTFEIMERRLIHAIMTPAMVIVWISGLTLAIKGEFLMAGWLHGKLALVILLSALHFYFDAARRTFAAGINRRTARFYRVINEVPTLLMIGVVIFVVLKP